MAQYDYTKESADLSLLTAEINADETIEQSVGHVNWDAPDSLSVFFDEALSGAEEDALDTVVADHDASGGGFYEELNHVEEKVPGRLLKETWCEEVDEDGSPSKVARTIEYTWDGWSLVSHVEKKYFKNGVVESEVEKEYYQNRSDKLRWTKAVTT